MEHFLQIRLKQELNDKLDVDSARSGLDKSEYVRFLLEHGHYPSKEEPEIRATEIRVSQAIKALENAVTNAITVLEEERRKSGSVQTIP